VGVLAYVLLSGHSPFTGDTKQETFLNITQGELDFPEDLFGDVSPAAMDFISALIQLNPRSGTQPFK
jgi:serine/threonine protein kinase